ncbi:unnamed protein product [Sphagnum tenellum]
MACRATIFLRACTPQGPRHTRIQGYSDAPLWYTTSEVAGGSDDNLSEKIHGGSVTDHSHAQHVANHGAPPYPDPLCSDGAHSESLQSLLSGHGPPRKHVNFSHPN